MCILIKLLEVQILVFYTAYDREYYTDDVTQVRYPSFDLSSGHNRSSIWSPVYTNNPRRDHVLDQAQPVYIA